MNVFAQIFEIIFLYGVAAGVIGTIFIGLFIYIIICLIKKYKGSEE